MRPIALLMLMLGTTPQGHASCIVGNAVPKNASVCLISEYVDALAELSEAERAATRSFPDTAQQSERAVYAMKRRIDVERRMLVASIDRKFSGRLELERDGNWESGWSAVAAAIRDNLLVKGWQFKP